jgi:DNA-binding NtrC family response regulator
VKLQFPHIKQVQDLIMQEFIVEDEVMRSIMKVVRQVAKYDVNVLITGESGTGKELLAKIIHLQSPRAEYPFVPINCGILSGMMFEDKLFGHEKGAFTGAIRQEKGCFEIADKGTLFLDEVSEIPLENQTDFLRVLEDFRFVRIGGNQLIKGDVRIVSATNKDLKDNIKEGLFREDLFYRLHVVPLHIPALRERVSAIPKMVDCFLNQSASKYKKPRPSVKQEVMDMFCHYDWPGNVRELKSLLERVVILNDNDVIDVKQLPSDFLWHFRDPPRTMSLKKIKQSAETKAILNVLYRVGGDKKRAAKMLGISPRTLRHKLNQYNLKVDQKGVLMAESSSIIPKKGVS